MTRTTNYIYVEGCAQQVNRAYNRGGAWVRVSEISELCEVLGTERLRAEITKDEYEARPPGSEDYDSSPPSYWRYLTTTEMFIGHAGSTDGVKFLAAEPIATLIARINAIEFPPIADDSDDALELNDRGAWTSGEDYEPLDLVSWPADASKLFLCLKANRSTSDGVLANGAYWCEVTALKVLLTPAGGEDQAA